MAATISACGKYRYWLSREGDASMRPVAFVMLNPSTADADIDDATIRRCRTFADGASFVVVNLYAYRATKPADMLAQDDPVGPDNEFYWWQVANRDFKIIVAWGANADPAHAEGVSDKLRHNGNTLYCLGVTKNGQPRHPLYVRSDQPIVPYEQP